MSTDKKPDPQPGQKGWRVVDVVQREHFTMLEPMEPINLTPEQKGWRVVDVVQREHFTMLEPMEPVSSPPKPAGLEVEGRGTTSDVGASDLATIRGLVDRLGVDRLQQIVGTFAAKDSGKAR